MNSISANTSITKDCHNRDNNHNHNICRICSVPPIVAHLDSRNVAQLIWHNKFHGQTYLVNDRYIKYNPWSDGISLLNERDRLGWIGHYHNVPIVLDYGSDNNGEWLITRSLSAHNASGGLGQQNPLLAIAAIAEGLRKIHSIPIESFPVEWIDHSWVHRQHSEWNHGEYGDRPPADDLVVVHGDACAPNTLIDDRCSWVGNVDFADLTIGDRWADLAVAQLSIGWNYGKSYTEYFYTAYGISTYDADRVEYYQRLYNAQS